MSEDDMKDFKKMSEILIKYLPELKDPCSEIDHILYKNEKKNIIGVDDLLADIDLHEYLHAYSKMVIDKNIVNQCLDNAFLKLVEQRARTKTWHLDKWILQLLESKNMYQICIGLKIFKTYFNADGFKDTIGRALCYAMSDLSKIPHFVEQDENEMAIFVAKHAKECHDLIKEEDCLPAYKAHDIFMEIDTGKEVGQYQIRALYEIIKSSKSSDILYDLLSFDFVSVVYTFLHYIRRFYTRYEELDKEMREMDKPHRQGFGEFSLMFVADDDIKPLNAELGDKKKKKKKKKPCSTLNKYFFYHDAMKTLSMLSFLYNCVEVYIHESNQECYKDKLQHFKVKSYVTCFVINLIDQHEKKIKIDKPIWIMEKILNTCHFIVFGNDEEKEKDIFMKLMNRDEIDEEDLSCLKEFMKKHK